MSAAVTKITVPPASRSPIETCAVLGELPRVGVPAAVVLTANQLPVRPGGDCSRTSTPTRAAPVDPPAPSCRRPRAGQGARVGSQAAALRLLRVDPAHRTTRRAERRHRAAIPCGARGSACWRSRLTPDQVPASDDAPATIWSTAVRLVHLLGQGRCQSGPRSPRAWSTGMPDLRQRCSASSRAPDSARRRRHGWRPGRRSARRRPTPETRLRLLISRSALPVPVAQFASGTTACRVVARARLRLAGPEGGAGVRRTVARRGRPVRQGPASGSTDSVRPDGWWSSSTRSRPAPADRRLRRIAAAARTA